MSASVLEPGLTIGKYKLLAHIATGGMGAVYKAVDQVLGRTVALKVLPAELARNSRALDRFHREARNVARLSNSHIVTLFECGHDADKDLHFIALEFIDGIDLDAYIRRRDRLEPEEVRRILIQAAKALEHAFARGVVHRDIKPSNLLLARVGRKVVVKLTDLGLARVAAEEEFKLTRDGCTVGTIDYMAPEQARDSQSADIRSDIYSLGCTAFHMLTGKAPFAEGGLGERLLKHLEAEPPDVRQINPAVSHEFQAVLSKMLAKKPEERYQAPGQLLADLKSIAVVAEAGTAEAGIAEVGMQEGRPAEARPARTKKKPSAARRPGRRKTVAEPSGPTQVAVPSAPAEGTPAAALHEHALQVLAQGGGEDYARQLLSKCLELEPYCIAYRQTLREIHRQASGSTLGRWLGSLTALAVKSKMHMARSAGNWRKVLEHGEEVLAHQPADVDAHLELAEAAEKLEQGHLALWLLEQGCQQAPDNVKLLRPLAELLEKRGDLKNAIALWQKIGALDPADPVWRRKRNDLMAQNHMAGGKLSH